MEIHSYPHIFSLGHRAVAELFMDPVLVEEKIDGSQFSVLVKDGQLWMRSKGAHVYGPNDTIENVNKLFLPAVVTFLKLFGEGKLTEGWTYRGEALHKPHHNALAYERAPGGGFILFDIDTGDQCYMPANQKAHIGSILNLEVVPVMFEGTVTGPDQIKEFLERTSVLGGQKIEGVVVKNYARFGIDKKCLMGKYVSEAYKEVHSATWKSMNGNGIEQILIGRYKTPARWNKAIQHLADSNLLTDSPADIGPLMKEINQDIERECIDEIKEALYSHYRKKIMSGCARGFPEYYKEHLMKKGFGVPDVGDVITASVESV